MKDLKCNSCGGQLHKIETEENTYICLHCGSKQVLEENITNNNYNVTNNVVNHIYGEVNVKGTVEDTSGVQNDFVKAEALIKIKEYEKAFYMLLDISEENPHIWKVWWLLSKTSLLASESFWIEDSEYDFDRDLYEEHFEKAMALAPETSKMEIEKEYKQLVKNYEKAMNGVVEACEILQEQYEKPNHSIRDTLIIIGVIIAFFVLLTIIIN